MTALPASGKDTSGAVEAAAGAERFLLLDGLRGLAAFAVILDHTPANVLGDLIPGRYLAVDFFFVLSGFVLAHAYAKRLEGGWPVLAFMRARIIRLYPLYLAGLAIGLAPAVFSVLQTGESTPLGAFWFTLLLGLLFLPTLPISEFGGGQLYPFNGPAWSLFLELVVNFIYGLIVRFLNRIVLGAILCAGAAAVLVTLMRHASVGGPGWLWTHFDAGLARVVFDFFAGVAIFRLRAHARAPRIPALIPVLAFLAIVAVPVAPDLRPLYDAAVAIILMPLLVAFASEAQVGGGLSQACKRLGAISFGVYILHVPLLQILSSAAQAIHAHPPAIVMVGLVVVVAGLAASLLDIVYDRQMRGWLNRVLPGRAND